MIVEPPAPCEGVSHTIDDIRGVRKGRPGAGENGRVRCYRGKPGSRLKKSRFAVSGAMARTPFFNTLLT
jgi:hypothetical protein